MAPLPQPLVQRLVALWRLKKGYIPPHLAEMLKDSQAKLEKRAA